MNRKNVLANSVLWATAIVAAALAGAPAFLSVLLLPALATLSFVAIAPGRNASCVSH